MKQTKKIIFAFPCLGKTEAAKHIPGLVDLDFGWIRSSANVWDGKGMWSFSLNRQYQILSNFYTENGFIVLCNEPDLIPWLKQQTESILMVLPNSDVDMSARFVERSKQQKSENAAIWDRTIAARNWTKWVTEWEQSAQKYGIPVVRVKFILEDWSVINNALQNN